jgi:Uma2 family endonuclease
VTDVAVDRWQWTVVGYEAAAAAGVFGPEPRVELLDGEVYKVSPTSPGHSYAVRQLRRLLEASLDSDLWVLGSQDPIRLDDRSEPEPDVWIARGPNERYSEAHPTAADLILAVEVSNTTLAFDRDIKIPLYAAAGVPEACIVSLPERVAYHYAQPGAGGYRSLETLDQYGVATLAGIDVPVRAILPPE